MITVWAKNRSTTGFTDSRRAKLEVRTIIALSMPFILVITVVASAALSRLVHFWAVPNAPGADVNYPVRRHGHGWSRRIAPAALHCINAGKNNNAAGQLKMRQSFAEQQVGGHNTRYRLDIAEYGGIERTDTRNSDKIYR